MMDKDLSGPTNQETPHVPVPKTNDDYKVGRLRLVMRASGYQDEEFHRKEIFLRSARLLLKTQNSTEDNKHIFPEKVLFVFSF